MKLQAALHGAKIDKGGSGATEQKPNQNEIMFKDPKEYEKLSPEERKKLTEQMLGKFKGMKLPGMGSLERVKKKRG